jgi:hypothetical protein
MKATWPAPKIARCRNRSSTWCSALCLLIEAGRCLIPEGAFANVENLTVICQSEEGSSLEAPESIDIRADERWVPKNSLIKKF